MEDILNQILVEIKGVKDEVKETKTELRSEMQEMEQRLHGEIQDVKAELHAEIQNVKTELRNEMQDMKAEILMEVDERTDKKLNQQTKEIAEEIHEILAYMEQKDKRREKQINEILDELKRNRMDHQIFDARLCKLEFEQERTTKGELKIS